MNNVLNEEQLLSGYLSFSRADISESIKAGGENTKAYQLLLEAMSANGSCKTQSGEPVNEIYPLTANAADVMEQKLKEAEVVAENLNDQTLKNRLNELKNVTEWSKDNHSNISFLVILGGILWILFYWITVHFMISSDSDEYRAKIEAWNDTPPSYEIVQESQNFKLINKYESTSEFKRYKLAGFVEDYRRLEDEYDDTRNLLYRNTLSREEQRRVDNMKNLEAKMDSIKKEFEVANAHGLEHWREMALSEISISEVETTKSRLLLWGVIAYFVIIIVLYIITNRPKGYMLSRQRTTMRFASGIKLVFYKILIWLGLSGARMGWTDPDVLVTAYWSNGNVTKHLITSDLINSSLVFKSMFYILALVFLMFGSAYLLPIFTIMGFFMNIDRRK